MITYIARAILILIITIILVIASHLIGTLGAVGLGIAIVAIVEAIRREQNGGQD
jgi:hypothetical protein